MSMYMYMCVYVRMYAVFVWGLVCSVTPIRRVYDNVFTLQIILIYFIASDK